MNNSKNKLKLKNSEGITLIALVVTIIILIILAGVSINMLIGENGIITKAKEAAKSQEVASIKEEIRLKILEQEIETEGNVTQEKIETILYEYGTVNKNEDGSINSLTPTGKDYEIAYEDIYFYSTSEGNNTGGSTSDGTNSGTGTGSDEDTVTLTREEYNGIIERLDAIDGGTKTSVSLSYVSDNMNIMQDNVTSSINDINNNIDNINSNFTSLKDRLGDSICIYVADSGANNYVVFNNVKKYFRVPALFIGNANGAPDLRTCALFSGLSDSLLCNITTGSITATDNGDGTADIRIDDVNAWGYYYLFVIAK